MAWKPSISELILAFYLLAITLELALSRLKVVKAGYETRDTLAAFGMTLGNILTNLMMAGIVFAGLSAAWKVRLFTISPASPWAWAALFFLDDFTYYWFHRISHECRFWWAAHVNHHSSQPLQSVDGAAPDLDRRDRTEPGRPWLPLALLGFPPQMILLSSRASTCSISSGSTPRPIRRLPAWFEYRCSTRPSHHRVHHASQPALPRPQLRRGADGLGPPVRHLRARSWTRSRRRYGVVKNIDTFNPFRIAFHEWIAMARDLTSAQSVREAAGLVLGPPGWRADGRGSTSRNIRAAWTAASDAPRNGRLTERALGLFAGLEPCDPPD